MKIFINGSETQDPSFQGETLEEVMNAILKNRQNFYIRRVWLDGKEVSSSAPKILQKLLLQTLVCWSWN